MSGVRILSRRADEAQILIGLEAARAVAAYNDGRRAHLTDWNLNAGKQGHNHNYLESDNKVLLKFFSAAVIGRDCTELESVPGDREGDMGSILILPSRSI